MVNKILYGMIIDMVGEGRVEGKGSKIGIMFKAGVEVGMTGSEIEVLKVDMDGL